MANLETDLKGLADRLRKDLRAYKVSEEKDLVQIVGPQGRIGVGVVRIPGRRKAVYIAEVEGFFEKAYTNLDARLFNYENLAAVIDELYEQGRLEDAF